MRLLQYILFVFFITGISNAQDIKVTGKVTDDQNQPLPGVNIVIKGSTNGTQTDFDGNYTILATIGDTLMFSYIGFETAEEKITAASAFMHIKLIPSSAELEEVVVTAYGSNRVRKSMSYAVSSNRPRRKGRKHRQRHVNKSPGVRVFNTGNTLKVRGVNSVSGAKQPMYVVDGVPVDNKDIAVVNAIDPTKIAKVEVLKNKKATSVYGSKAKHGCIVITTHSGNYKVQNDESYREIVENDFKKVQMAPLSTFSIDVDKASYSNIRRMINNGVKVPADAVKIEEMINYFNYQYEQPKDEHPFAIHTEYASTPWNTKTQLVKIGLKGKEIPQHEIPASNLVFLIDVSGSMSNSNKLPLLKKAFKLLVNQLREKDKVSIVVYAGAAGMVLKPTSGANKHEINQALQNLEAGGSTAGGEGIRLAYKIAKENFIKNGNNRVILATDGDFNVGISSDKDMKKLIEEKRKSNVFLTCLGFGMGNYKDSKLETLADTGNGNHSYIDTMQEAQRVLGQEFGGTLYTIAKDVKIQVEFNPGKVQAYRLIGYENRLLADEDFIDDTKDAGELGSGHTVTALYEVIPVGVKNKYLKEIADLKYTNSTIKKEYGDELLTVKFRYKKPQEKKSIEMVHVLHTDTKTSASQDFNFAASIAWFGMKLRGSKCIENQDIKDIIDLAQTNKEKDNQGYKAEFIRLMNSYLGLEE
ncbi:Ca-activated chloride channel family protein [Aquimarina sp. EL_43]|uniref:vWA domain-containing protein n=1 Tax=unclassified Aquimarina TaxID=2627091 RepID=UPI0018CB7E23|nr:MULTISPECIES: VWA domain-containing protein [unclassified Aquimarina]MBG6129357.1 Ca-activated chloride channel family protein [Aquimarina sp. EL_35]MBG6150422.1 Ca-activated chloride channel family protein [Aquimarina sp. EL_32]MBG6168270.1 Ca-activated chloride channel family protein [Aquimarina sp. EL_43]